MLFNYGFVCFIIYLNINVNAFVNKAFVNKAFVNKNYLTGNRVLRPLVKTVVETDYYPTWDDGEVEWIFETEDEADTDTWKKNEIKPPSQITVKKPEQLQSVREKIWGLVEELRVQGSITGIINVAYYNIMVSDNIMNDVQNFALPSNLDIIETINRNHVPELDAVMTLITIIGYNKNQTNRINRIMNGVDNNNNNYYVETYKRQRAMAAMAAIIFIIILFKNVKSVA
jgi:hypothetical protein